MADSFWLKDEDDVTLVLDTSVLKMTIGGFQRDYRTINYVGATGGQIRGFGVPGPRKFKVSRKEKVENGDMNFWNSRRDDFMRFITKSRNKQMWLYIRNGEDTITVRSLCFPQSAGDDSFDFFHITSMKSYTFLLPEGAFENIVSTTENLTITGSAKQDLALTNAGTWEVSGLYKFTPTADETLFQVVLSDQKGFKLEGNFAAGQQIIYNTADNSLTIGGNQRSLSQFLTGGSVFNLPQGDQTLEITCSGPGSFQLEYNERYE